MVSYSYLIYTRAFNLYDLKNYQDQLLITSITDVYLLNIINDIDDINDIENTSHPYSDL